MPSGVGNFDAVRPALRVEAVEPVRLHERLALAGTRPSSRSSTYITPLRFAHSITLRGRALPLDVGQHRHLRRVVVELVVRRELVVPLQLAGVGVERDDAVAVQVVAERGCGRPSRAPDCRCRSTRGSSRDRRRRRSTRRRRRSSTSRPPTCRCPARRDRESCRSATASLPVFASNAAMKPRIGPSPPPVPTITLSFTISGACVIE